jgi:hypothetical protein
MPRLTMFLPPDVIYKLDTYEALDRVEPSEVVQHKLRQFPAHALEVDEHAAA